ncbi:MAG: stage II sporulation protein M [Bacilli bacterium]
MKKIVDKLKNKVTIDKKLLVFLIVLGLIGVLVGSVFVTILNNSDKVLISDYLNNFLNNIESGQLDYLLALKNNLFNIILFVSIIWLLGISVIGLPIMIMMYFTFSFIMGFSIGSIILAFKLKGLLFALIYIFPSGVISLIILILLMIYAMSFSFKLIYTIFKKKTIDFKYMMNKYLIVLGIVLIVMIITSLYDTYIMPNIVKSIISFIR